MHCPTSVALLILAIILMILGGLADACGEKRVFGISKQHLWADGLFALGLSAWVLLYRHTCGGYAK